MDANEMNLEKMARDLGAAIQRSDIYKKYVETHDKNEQDSELSELIGKLQLVHMSYQHEASKDSPDEGKLAAYEDEFNGLYKSVSANPNMKEYEKARNELDELMKYLTGILTLCVRGEDPYECDPDANVECGGNCSSCGGCH